MVEATPDERRHLSVSAIKLADKCSLAGPEAAWMAAIMDAEGSISVRRVSRMSCGKKKPGWVVRLNVTNTDIRLLHRVQELVGGKISGPHQNPSDSPRAKPRYQWMGGAEVARFTLPAIRPWLVCKGEIADLVLEALEMKAAYPFVSWTDPESVAQFVLYRDRLEEIGNRVYKLNERGVAA